MKRFTVKIECRSRSEAARALILAQLAKSKEDRMTQMAISKVVRTTVQNVNEQMPAVRRLVKAFAL